MKISINKVLSALQVMARLAGERHSIRFAYRVQRIYDKLLREAKRIDSQRQKMQERFGATKSEAGTVNIPPDKRADAEKEWSAFCEEEMELDCWTLTMDLIETENVLAEKQPNIQKIAISAGDLIALGPIFDPQDKVEQLASEVKEESKGKEIVP